MAHAVVDGVSSIGDRIGGRLGDLLGPDRIERLKGGASEARDAAAQARDAARRGAAFGAGAGLQTINIAISKAVPTMRDSDLLIINRSSLQRGADAVNRRFRPQIETIDYDALRATRPLIGHTRIDVADLRAPARLDFDAVVAGDDYATHGQESSPVSIFVDGHYHSDVMVLGERPSAYDVNLAGLPVGSHDVELRFARDIAPAHAGVPQVSDLRSKLLEGDAALAARFAPMLETRLDLRDQHHPPATYTDLPLVLTPTVQHHADGGTSIHYNLLYSNEDGGTPVTATFRRFGRATDYEPVHTVSLDAAGNVTGDRFQGPGHIPWHFHGEHVGERPVLRVGTPNGLFTSHSLAATPRWSEAPRRVRDAPPSDRDVMLGNPWTFAVMNKELQREHKVAAPRGVPGPGQARDSRDYLYLDVGSDAARQAFDGARQVTLRLTDGSVVTGSIDPKGRMPVVPNRPALGTAVPLPPGVTGSDVAEIVSVAARDQPPNEHLPPGRLFVLDAAYAPRMLAKTTVAPHRGVTTPTHPGKDESWTSSGSQAPVALGPGPIGIAQLAAAAAAGSAAG